MLPLLSIIRSRPLYVPPSLSLSLDLRLSMLTLPSLDLRVFMLPLKFLFAERTWKSTLIGSPVFNETPVNTDISSQDGTTLHSDCSVQNIYPVTPALVSTEGPSSSWHQSNTSKAKTLEGIKRVRHIPVSTLNLKAITLNKTAGWDWEIEG